MRRWTLGVAIAGFVLAVLMIITLIVFWNVYIVGDFRTIKELSQSLESLRIPASAGHDPGARWAVLATGSVFFTLILVALSLFFSSYLVNRRYRSFQTDWINMTTHELKLPIANIQLFAQTLQRSHLSEEDRTRFLSLIFQETRRLDQLVSRLLQARRIEGGMQELRLERVDLRDWIREYAQRPSSPGFLLNEGPTAKLRIDRGLMESILDNLLQNALKYGNGSNPEVRTAILGSSIAVEVVDQGLGIPAKYRKKIFQRFFRIPSREHRRQTGTGLGLYIASASVQMLGGAMGMKENPEGKGSVFWFRLPVIP
jgi:two-component system, OmpR family, phosphate regulon sensor histidine kinase PhoR